MIPYDTEPIAFESAQIVLVRTLLAVPKPTNIEPAKLYPSSSPQIDPRMCNSTPSHGCDLS